MFDHVGLNVRDYAASRAFYERVLAPIGYGIVLDFPEWKAVGFGRDDRPSTLHRLEGAAPSVRVATRLFTAVSFEDVVPRLLRPDFDLRTDAVVMASAPTHGVPLPASSEVIEETPTRLRVRIVAPADALVVWSRTYFKAWRARVDGQATDVQVARTGT